MREREKNRKGFPSSRAVLYTVTCMKQETIVGSARGIGNAEDYHTEGYRTEDQTWPPAGAL